MAAAFAVPGDHPCLPGHFPGRPVVPGVVVLDHVLAAIEAQAGPLAAVRIPQVKFLQPLLPGQVATVVLEERPLPGRRAWRFRVECAGAAIASGEIQAADGGP